MRRFSPAAALAGGAVLAQVLAGCTAAPGGSFPPGGVPPAPVATGAAAAPAVPARCAGPPTVTGADELAEALRGVRPGAVVVLAPGLYPGRFTAAVPATADAPVTVCGGRDAVLDGGPVDDGYTLHLDGADHWRLAGFSVRGGQKGVVVDRSQHVVVDGLAVTDVGDEAVHLRAYSADGVVTRTVVRRTGRNEPRFGEGVYVGSAVSNWCRWSGCGPDRSDRARIEDNDIADTTAEAVDVKEGTTGGVLRGNRFDGAGTTDADSWVDVKGNGWTVAGNHGARAPEDGFQVHVVEPGWGRDTRFTANTAAVDAAGHGFAVDDEATGTVVGCDNVVTGAAGGLSTLPCSG
ncbi:hypothetical protein [Pseudonocardia alni]|uniref:hypothetical protein n=1 Tax=Pseudonocardia alni TaxID=33907 RepID=UPI00331B8415